MKESKHYGGVYRFHEVILNTGNLASGIYFYCIVATSADGSKSFSDIKKIIPIK